MIYDLVIVGSGPVALSCLLSAPSNLKIAVISHSDRGEYIRDSFGDKAYINRYGGGLDAWHGVLSSNLFLKHYPDELDFYIKFFKFFYPEKNINNNLFGFQKIFIPKKKISSKNLNELLKERTNIKLFFDEVLHIDESKVINIYGKNEKYLSNRVILAAGAIGTAKILNNSQLGQINKFIGNHIIGYGQYNISTNNEFVKSEYSRYGHFKNIEISSIKGKEFMSYQRPSLFDFRNSKILGKYKTVYSRTKKEIYSTIIKSMSPGLFAEAFYNRYGYWFKTNKANTYLQIESSNVYELDNKFNIIVSEKNINLFVDNVVQNSKFNDLDIKTIVSGIHFFNTINKISDVGSCSNKDDWQKKIIVADSSVLKKIGGSHHTFSLMSMASLSMQRFYSN